jgi:hypothetical protein
MGIQVITSGNAISAYLKLAGNVALSSSLVAVVDQADNVSPLQLATASIGLVAPTFLALPTWTNTLGTKDGFSSQQTVAVASVGTGVFRLIRNAYTINNTAAQTGSVTGFFLNATETLLNGIAHNLMDLQVGGVSKFRVRADGSVFALGGDFNTFRVLSNQGIFQGSGLGAVLISETSGFNRIQLGGTTSSFPAIKRNGAAIDFRLADDSAFCNVNANAFFLGGLGILGASSDGVLRITNNANTDFNRLQLGGTTSSFPAIKRNGAAIDFRLADDSAACNINANTFIGVAFSATGYIATEVYYGGGSSNFRFAKRADDSTWGTWNNGAFCVSATAVNASAILQADSTTKGFLMPRQTQAQILAIVLPANGLMVYNTNLNQPCFFDGTIWKKLNDSPM